MNMNAAIVDPHLNLLVEDIREEAATRLNLTDASFLATAVRHLPPIQSLRFPSFPRKRV